MKRKPAQTVRACVCPGVWPRVIRISKTRARVRYVMGTVGRQSMAARTHPAFMWVSCRAVGSSPHRSRARFSSAAFSSSAAAVSDSDAAADDDQPPPASLCAEALPTICPFPAPPFAPSPGLLPGLGPGEPQGRHAGAAAAAATGRGGGGRAGGGGGGAGGGGSARARVCGRPSGASSSTGRLMSQLRCSSRGSAGGRW